MPQGHSESSTVWGHRLPGPTVKRFSAHTAVQPAQQFPFLTETVLNCSDCFSFLLRFFFFFFYLRVTEDTQSSLWTAGLLGNTTKQPLFWREAAMARVKNRAPTWQSSRCPSAEADLPGKWEEVYQLKHQENRTRLWCPSLPSGRTYPRNQLRSELTHQVPRFQFCKCCNRTHSGALK